jgi:hypothetical protein
MQSPSSQQCGSTRNYPRRSHIRLDRIRKYSKRPPNRMVRSPKPVWGDLSSAVLVFPIEASISWSVPELLYLRVLEKFHKLQIVD